MIAMAKQAHKKILVDPAFGADYKKYLGASLLTPNRQETALAVDGPVESFDHYKNAADQLRSELELEAVVITLDKEGAFLCTDQAKGLIPTRSRKVYDVTGAGDMVLAMLATALAGGCDYKTAVQLANIAGGLEVEKFGVATVSIEEIVNEIIGQNQGKDGKVHTLDTLLTKLQWHRSRNETVVFTNGCFDVLHRGHIDYLSFCKQQGDVVVVGLNSDRSVKAIKGPERPINHQFDRAAVLAALESVDYITIFEEPDPLALIKAVLPDVLVKGQDWQDKGVIGSDVVTENGGKVVLAPMTEGKSSTSIIERFKGLLKRHQ
jgi:D-beta-D-heptose 7-phosphate kinase/D-beta-D-heptose 1-phosphate adenosyltransferase